LNALKAQYEKQLNQLKQQPKETESNERYPYRHNDSNADRGGRDRGGDQWEKKANPENWLGEPIDPWTAKAVPGPGVRGRNYEQYSRNDTGPNDGDQWTEDSSQNLLRQKDDYVNRAGFRDVFDDVMENGEAGERYTGVGGYSAPIRAGVNRPCSSGTVGGNRRTNSRRG
jgi:hypothetical protein